MPPPFVAVVVRPDSGYAEASPTATPSQFNGRPVELVSPQQAPEKPRQGDTPARPARMPMYSVVAARQIRSVMYDSQSGVIGKTEFQQFVSSPRGKSLSWDERSNISHDFPEAYGSHYTLDPQTEDGRLRLEMGM
jgi:hypothetical protein